MTCDHSSVRTVCENPSSGSACEVKCVMWPSGTSLGRGLISQSPSRRRLSFSFFRPWPMCQRTVSLCWTAAERTGRNGKPLQNSRRRHWSMVKAARPSGTKRPVHTELKLTYGVSPVCLVLLYTVQVWCILCHCCIFIFAQLLTA